MVQMSGSNLVSLEKAWAACETMLEALSITITSKVCPEVPDRRARVLKSANNLASGVQLLRKEALKTSTLGSCNPL